MRRKKSKYKHVKINKKKFYFYKINWLDITADGGHATADEFDKFEASRMVSFGYVYKKTKKFLYTFASYDEKDEVYSDRTVFPIGCITKMEKLNVYRFFFFFAFFFFFLIFFFLFFFFLFGISSLQ